MTSAEAVSQQTVNANQAKGYRRLSTGTTPSVFTEIYDDPIHIAIWQRTLSASLQNTVATFVESDPDYRLSVAVTPENANKTLFESMKKSASQELCNDVAELVGMFCMLFGLERAGVRLGVLGNAMCPK
ncbi:MAG: DUF1826 domain-containing protein, partial [Pseudomonadota bacterium]